MDFIQWRNLADASFDGVYIIDSDHRFVYWNKAAEQITGYASGDVLGKRCSDNILMHVNDKGEPICTQERCPTECSILDGERQDGRVFLRHRSGHRLPVQFRVLPVQDSSGNPIGAAEIFRPDSSGAELARMRELEDLALRDTLTGVGNRRYGDARLEACLSNFARYGWPFGVLFVDVDHFKQINDSHGHRVGDAVLRMVGQTLLRAARKSDSVVRWGGEEFLLLPLHIDEWQLENLGNKLRGLVASAGYSCGGKTVQVTVSIGCTLVEEGDDPSRIVDRADKAMYSCKKSGRNKVVFMTG